MPCLDPQMQQEGVLMKKTAEIQGFVEANMLETHFRAGGFFLSHTRVRPKQISRGAVRHSQGKKGWTHRIERLYIDHM
jgi:hypothetical protein